VVRKLHPEQFEWLSWGRIRSTDRLSGSDRLYRAAEGEEKLADVLEAWAEEARAFAAESAEYHLYK